MRAVKNEAVTPLTWSNSSFESDFVIDTHYEKVGLFLSLLGHESS